MLCKYEFFHQNCLDKSLMVFMFLLCVYVTLLRIFTHDKPKKISGVIVVCSGLELTGNSLKICKTAGYVKNWTVEHFLCS